MDRRAGRYFIFMNASDRLGRQSDASTILFQNLPKEDIRMTLLDIVFLLLLIIFCARGFFHGILKEIAGIAGVVIGFWVANHYHAELTPYILPYMSSPGSAETASYIVTVVLVTVASWILIRGLSNLLKLALLSWADHALGGAFGFIKGILLCAIVLLALTTFMPGADFVQGSMTAPYIGRVTVFLAEFLPEDMQAMFDKGVKKLKDIKMPEVNMPEIDLPELKLPEKDAAQG